MAGGRGPMFGSEDACHVLLDGKIWDSKRSATCYMQLSCIHVFLHVALVERAGSSPFMPEAAASALRPPMAGLGPLLKGGGWERILKSGLACCHDGFVRCCRKVKISLLEIIMHPCKTLLTKGKEGRNATWPGFLGPVESI